MTLAGRLDDQSPTCNVSSTVSDYRGSYLYTSQIMTQILHFIVVQNSKGNDPQKIHRHETVNFFPFVPVAFLNVFPTHQCLAIPSITTASYARNLVVCHSLVSQFLVAARVARNETRLDKVAQRSTLSTPYGPLPIYWHVLSLDTDSIGLDEWRPSSRRLQQRVRVER